MTDRRLIEDSLPLAEISETSAREKSIRHGHISTLHLWWARRPLAAARAATLAALMPAPKDETERRAMHQALVDVLDWEHAKQPEAFAAKLRALLGRYRDDTPRILDPFAGGGALPLEAERIGAEAHASDLNPVAHLIQLATLGYPQRFAHLTSTRKAADQLVSTGAPRLVSEVAYWGRQVLERVRAEIGWAYAAEDEPLFYVWARTVTCANAACRAEIPLVGSYYLIKKRDYVVALKPVAKPEERRVDFEVVENPRDFDPKDAIIRRANAVCPCCGQTSSAKYLKQQGKAGALGHRLLAVAVREGVRGKRYRIPGEADLLALNRVDDAVLELRPSAIPDEPLPVEDTRAFFVGLYGMETWGDLYNSRQALVLAHLARAVSNVRQAVIDANSDLGADSADFAKAVVTYLGLASSKLADYFSTICILNSTGGRGVAHTFRLQAIPMTWDYVESNPFNEVAASIPKILDDMVRTIELLSFSGSSDVRRSSADRLGYDAGNFDAIITDPPYYDAVPYSDLSDYFYVWLKRCLADVHPSLFATELTPKRSEMVQNPVHGKDAAFFEEAMSRAFGEMHRTLKDEGILVLVFAHKSTAAWETLLKALLARDLVVTASWPIETEKPGRPRAQGSAALASSVFIVCRKRVSHGDGFIDDIEPELRARLTERLDYFWKQGIRGADFFMSAIGPAVEVFGRCKQVRHLTGDPVEVSDLLTMVRQIVADYALHRIVKSEARGEVDPRSRFYVLWRWAFGAAHVESGEAIAMAQSLGCEFNALVTDDGMLNLHGSSVRLRGPSERKGVRRLGLPDRETGEPAPLVDVLHQATELWTAGDRQGLADFLAEALPSGDREGLARLAQSIVDVLQPEDRERKLYENFLVGSRSLPDARPRAVRQLDLI